MLGTDATQQRGLDDEDSEPPASTLMENDTPGRTRRTWPFSGLSTPLVAAESPQWCAVPSSTSTTIAPTESVASKSAVAVNSISSIPNIGPAYRLRRVGLSGANIRSDTTSPTPSRFCELAGSKSLRSGPAVRNSEEAQPASRMPSIMSVISVHSLLRAAGVARSD